MYFFMLLKEDLPVESLWRCFKCRLELFSFVPLLGSSLLFNDAKDTFYYVE